MSEPVSQEFISRKLDQVLDEVKRVRADNVMALEALSLLQKTTVNLDRRLSDVKDELEMTIKIEVSGRLANAETRFHRTHLMCVHRAAATGFGEACN